MSQSFTVDCGLLAVADSKSCPARAGERVRVVGTIGNKAVERVHLNDVGELHGYTVGMGFAIVLFSGRRTPTLVIPECIAPAISPLVGDSEVRGDQHDG